LICLTDADRDRASKVQSSARWNDRQLIGELARQDFREFLVALSVDTIDLADVARESAVLYKVGQHCLKEH
jgi:hypothetical protein